MKNEEIEREINERVKFKMNELKDSIRNRLATNRASAFSLILNNQIPEGVKTQHFAEAYQDFLEAFNKEVELATPTNEMHRNKVSNAKNNLTDELMVWFDNELKLTKQYTPSFRYRMQKMLANGMEKLLQTKIL